MQSIEKCALGIFRPLILGDDWAFLIGPWWAPCDLWFYELSGGETHTSHKNALWVTQALISAEGNEFRKKMIIYKE